MERDGRDKTLYEFHFSYTLPKLIADSGLEDPSRGENPDSLEFARYNKSFATGSTIDRVYIDIKKASNTKINHIIVSFTDHYFY